MRPCIIIEGSINRRTDEYDIDSCPAICTNSDVIKNYLRTQSDEYLWSEFEYAVWEWGQSDIWQSGLCTVLKELSEWYEFDVHMTEVCLTSGDWDIENLFNTLYPHSKLMDNWKTL